MRSRRFIALPIAAILFAVSANTSYSQTPHPQPEQPSSAAWHLLLAHDEHGKVGKGDRQQIVNAVRQGCRIRIAWGSKGATRTIEHIAEPMWIAIRDSRDIEVQIGDFMINLNALGDSPVDHPRREQFGGVEKVVKWRASLKPDGTFNAIWYYPHNGEFITRVPQRHPMKWFADCEPEDAETLFQLSQGS